MTGRHDGRRIRLGMVGGGEGAFIGAVHRIAARLDDRYEIVAGALSSTPERSARSAEALGLARSYPDFAGMAREEAARPDGIEAVSIVTPNHLHAAAAHAFLDAGIHVICDKPMTATLGEARALAEHARRSGLVFALTHNYTGYPMVRQARDMVREGRLGAIRVVQVEYAQDWLAEAFEETGNKQAGWRTDPARAGAGGCIGDIGTHAFNLAAFVTGIAAEAVSAELTTFVPGRRLDDDVRAMLRYAGGARGSLWASQVAVGEENEVRLRVYGTAGGIDWCQRDANRLSYTPLGGVRQVLTRNGAGAGEANRRASRVPAGHPEGYLEGFATIYSDAADAILAARGGLAQGDPGFPSVADGVAGLAFVEAAVRSSAEGGAWTEVMLR
ncbi:Gfo/Idh/MocA family protein [Lichenibacterium dinghuense]|uniref:Gfo/Idh/MocA family protein n=1 Tax=Lichenibacterium dinghuense TaxID=2895977 RepID=UPI001F1D7F00|nr:Gfo/Idh/MocA family oxidoreductase [Lichenibacterium sp. 6Y81]